MTSFDNTEIAFSDRTDKELKRAYFLFRMVGNSTLVKIGKILLDFAFILNLPVKGLLRSTVFEHFCGGENITKCESTIERLYHSKIFTLLDYSAEAKETLEDSELSASEIIATIRKAKNDKRIPYGVFKPSGIIPHTLLAKINSGSKLNGSDTEQWVLAKKRVHRICKAGKEAGVPVFIDAEETWIQDAIDQLVEELMQTYNREKTIVFNTIQLYRKDRLNFLKFSFEKAQRDRYKLGVKLVRGAYMEKEHDRAKQQGYPSPIHDSKSDTDRDYDQALTFCLEHHPKISVIAGTHNELSSKHLTDLMNKKELSSNDSNICFSQLYGMSDNISYNLAKDGFNVVKYVPYGPISEVMPYLIRRAEENTSIAGQTGRELALIIKEQNRRKYR